MAGAGIHIDEASYFEEPLVGFSHFNFEALCIVRFVVKKPRR